MSKYSDLVGRDSARGSAPKLSAEAIKGLPLLRNPAACDALVKYAMDRIAMAAHERDRRADRCELIDIQLSGFIQHTEDDKKRKADNEAGKAPKPTNHNLTLAASQIDEAVTYLMSVYAPEMDIFEAVAAADKQQQAQALTALVNRQGQRGAYYRHFAKFCLNSIKYNFGALTCNWEDYQGIVFKGNAGGPPKKDIGSVWSGNALKAANTYNFFYDTTVHPVDLPDMGEYFAEVERITPFRARRMAADKMLFGIERFIDEEFTVAGARTPGQGTGVGNTYYRQPPSVREDGGSGRGGVNWTTTLRGIGEIKESSPGLEIATFTAWLCPKEHKLGDSVALELWRLRIVNSKYLGFAAKLEDSHGQLPVVIATPLEDDLGNEQRTYAEQLIPLGQYCSFLVNTDQTATRKALFGITVFDQKLFPGLDADQTDLIGAKIPMRSTSGQVDIDKSFRHFNDSPNTEQNIQKLEQVMAVMQKILPTDMIRQIADLERATEYQAAATVQAGNRRNLKIARMIDNQALTKLKFQMIYNIYAQVTVVDFVDPVTGVRTEIPTGDLVDAQVEFDIATGLKGLDRLMQIQIIKDVMNAVIQSKEAIQEIDILKLLAYFVRLAGDRTDLNQFRRAAPTTVPGQPPAPGAAPNGQQQPQQQPQPSNAPTAGGHAAGAAT